ncbi:MAG: decaprenyl-phosphate phosphoribosyltransferase [Firmicutes bacterium]|nr:decaprenyl-phosphate phosphoribosyltransferase [Bacillota bacterium]
MTMTFKAADILLLLRPRQWTKNLLLFAGLIFSLNLFKLNLLLDSLIAFVSFCLLSSCVYIVNDIVDIEEDRKHPRKRHRPLAAGKIGIRQAAGVLIILLLVSLFLAWSINTLFLVMGLIYFALCLAYSLWLKYTVILDVFAIAFGFLLRAAAGGAAINVEISPWLLVCTLLLALFLALTKRRQESINLEDNGKWHRKVLEHYPVQYLDQLISIVTAATILAYSLYTFTASRSSLYMLTIPFVIYGIFRYLYLVHNEKLGENPEEILLRDTPTLVNIILWALVSIFILYLDWLR